MRESKIKSVFFFQKKNNFLLLRALSLFELP